MPISLVLLGLVALLALALAVAGLPGSARRKPGDYPDAAGILDTVEHGEGEGYGAWVEAELIRDGPNGPEIVRRHTVHNLVVNAGKRQSWRVLCGLNSKTFDQIRIGSGSAAPNSANTNLQTPIANSLNTVDSKTISGRTGELLISYPSGGGTLTATVREMVVLNENTSPGGSALARALLSPAVVKTTADKLRIRYRWRIT